MSGVGCSSRAQVCSYQLLSCSNIDEVNAAVEDGKRSFWLVVWNFVSSFVYSSEAKVAVLTNLAAFDSINHQWSVASLAELVCIGVINGKRHCLATEPVADVVSISIEQRDPDTRVQDTFKILEKGGVNKITSLLEVVVNVGIRVSVVEVDSQSLLRCRKVQEVFEIAWWRRVVERMTDVVDTCEALSADSLQSPR